MLTQGFWIITGVNFGYFLQLQAKCLKNVRLIGQYNSSFDNAFVFEQGRKCAFFNHIEYLEKDEIISLTKEKYLTYLKAKNNPLAKNTIELLKVNGKYYRMAWKNDNDKIILFEDDWLLYDYNLLEKGKIIRLFKQEHEDFQNIPIYKKASQLYDDKKWYNYLLHDVLIVKIHHEVFISK